MRARLVGEVATVLGLPVPAGQPDPEPTPASQAADVDLTDPELADIPQTIEAATAAALTLLGASVLDEDFIQLTAPRQLPLLDGGTRSARLIRYAPADAREVLLAERADNGDPSDPTPLSDVAWTTTGQTIGVLRLVPARPGVLRIADAAALTGTMLQIEVSGSNEDRAAESLAAWLGAGNDPDRQVTLLDPRDGPVIVMLRSGADGQPAAREVIDWLRTAEEQTAATFTGSSTQTVTATEARAATDAESDVIAARIAKQCGQPVP
jgi:hypothetical protein